MFQLSFSLTPNPEKTREIMRAGAVLLKNYRPALLSTVDVMAGGIERTIFDQPSSWPKLSKKWLEQKKRRGMSPSMMIATGRLLGSLRRVSLGAKTMRVGTTLKYAGPASWGTKRPFNLVTDRMEDFTVDAVEKRIDVVLQAMVSKLNAGKK